MGWIEYFATGFVLFSVAFEFGWWARGRYNDLRVDVSETYDRIRHPEDAAREVN